MIQVKCLFKKNQAMKLRPIRVVRKCFSAENKDLLDTCLKKVGSVKRI